jgi:DNA-binding IclR family transcriptional regulator
MTKMVGATMPLHATAIGKALLLHQDDDVLDAVIGDRLLRPFTPHTIVRPSLLREHLAAARHAGVVLSREEWRLGTSAVAAPVMVGGETIAAVAALSPFEYELPGLIASVRTAAARFGAALEQSELMAAA